MNKKYLISGIVFSVLCVACIVLTAVFYDTGKVEGGPNNDAPTSSTVHKDYKSPVDFEKLWEQNEEVHAWLTIPNTDINYPVVQSKTDDAFYLRRGLDGKYSVNGTLFTEKGYNGTEFSDPVTAIYGHDMKSGAMFGRLQEMYQTMSPLRQTEKLSSICPIVNFIMRFLPQYLTVNGTFFIITEVLNKRIQ